MGVVVEEGGRQTVDACVPSGGGGDGDLAFDDADVDGGDAGEEGTVRQTPQDRGFACGGQSGQEVGSGGSGVLQEGVGAEASVSPGLSRRARPGCGERWSPRPTARTAAGDEAGVVGPPTDLSRRARSRRSGAPVPRRGPASRPRCWTAALSPARRSAPSGPHTGAAAPPRHARPVSSRQPPPTADGPTLNAQPPERCPDVCAGYDLDTRILAGQRHLSAIGASDRPIPLNTQGYFCMAAVSVNTMSRLR